MNELRLRFSDGDQPDLVLGAGVHALGRLPTGLGPVDGEQAWLLQLCNDRRGIWMTVADELRGVHVNGRPVQHVAMLRAGDSIHVDGNELLLTAANDGRAMPQANGAPRDPIGNLRLVLRGVGGAHHGRSISLEQPRKIGRAGDADIRIEGPGIAERHATVEAVNGQAVLRDAGADVLVNGQRVRQAALHAGDQIAFDVQHRFVLEGPPPTPGPSPAARLRAAFADDADELPAPPRKSWLQRMPWLLVAAILLAAALSALLLFGTR
ncbi:FHA domain-containing protein [Thermomonas aquatica]|jgi:pSer/pThr/pTyr-binding forkhead associated (FHA) protein|uniref:FHA domain-containing protein n=1 Tax=Thermomonas aquatica TaxID=2202149 RepID=A0A5B7ZMX9_9GAMM|nr:FHA domain-containing protein [Thermomonas aquatica]QDA55893.1 FHA domain-containing protein [Thermomonas aquatica]